jgi:hypothetical protein
MDHKAKGPHMIDASKSTRRKFIVRASAGIRDLPITPDKVIV